MNFRLRHLVSLTLISLQSIVPLVSAATYGPHPYWDADNNVYDLGGIPLRINSGAIIGSGGFTIGTGTQVGNRTLDIWGITYIFGNQFIHYIPTYESFGIGKNSLNSLSTGANNISIGSGSLFKNTSGFNNTALGRSALQDNATGNWNTAIGTWGLYKNTSGSDNTAIGASTLSSNTSGGGNTGLGSSSLAANITGTQNTGLGAYSLNTNTSGGNNTSVGYWSLYDNTTGNWNTAIGGNAGSDTDLFGGPILGNITGWANTYLGYRATAYSSGYNYSSAIGAFSLVTASNTLSLGAVGGVNGAASDTQVVIGSGAASSGVYRLDVQKGYINTSSGLCINGDCKSAWSQVGGSLPNATSTGNTLRWTGTGWSDSNNKDILVNGVTIGRGTGAITGNLMVGINSFSANITGVFNTALGDSALQKNTDGGVNVALGHESLRENTSGNYNTAVGAGSLKQNVLGYDNVAIGANTLGDNLNGNQNVAIGYATLRRSSGNNNIGIGADSLWDLHYGNKNIVIGSASTVVGSGSNNILIGNELGTASGSNNILNIGGWILGSNGYISIGTGTSSFRLDVGNGYINSASGFCINGDCKDAWGDNYWMKTGNTVYYLSGNIGIGTDNALAKLAVNYGEIEYSGGNLIINGDFTGDANGWDLYDCANYNSNAVTMLYNSCSYPIIQGGFTEEAGKIYRIIFTVTGMNSGNGDFINVSSAGSKKTYHTNGTHSFTFRSLGTGGTEVWFDSIGGNNGTTWTLDDVIIQEVVNYTELFNITGIDGFSFLTLGGNYLNNVSIGEGSLHQNTYGSLNSALGYFADVGSESLINATAIGAQSYVTADNTMVLGSVNGVNGATADTQVVIGTGAAGGGNQGETYRLDVQNGFVNSASGFCINGVCRESWTPTGTTLKKILLYGGEKDGIIHTSSNTLQLVKTIDKEMFNMIDISCPQNASYINGYYKITYTDQTSAANIYPEIRFDYDGSSQILQPGRTNYGNTKYKTISHGMITGMSESITNDPELRIRLVNGTGSDYFELIRLELEIQCNPALN